MRPGDDRCHQAIVIGAGPGGLGTAACLQAAGLEAVVLESGDDVATRWRHGYERLQANTSRWFSYLPGRPLPREAGRWVSRDQLVAYYREYAKSQRLQILTGVEALNLKQADQGWRIATSTGDFWARAVVLATGRQRLPVIPAWNGVQEFAGEVIHSEKYRSAEAYAGARAIVVGAGNSGADISVDLAEGGAAEVLLSTRRAPHILRREVFGVPHDAISVLARYLPRGLADRAARVQRQLLLGDLSDFGLPIPRDGAVSRFERDGRVPTIDSGGFVRAVRQGSISIVPGVAGIDVGGALLADGRRAEADVIIAATGYRPALETLVGGLGLLDPDGLPVVHGEVSHPTAPNLHFVGFVDPRSGQLRELRLQARQVARAIRRSLAVGQKAEDSEDPARRALIDRTILSTPKPPESLGLR